MQATVPLLELSRISKAYPSVVANDAIDLTVMLGEIHAVLGENGAGKSTLMKIIYGIVKPDAGSIRWNGSVVRIASPAHARSLGIGMVFQHFSLFETLTVAENIELALRPGQDKSGLERRIREVSRQYELALDPMRHIHNMSAGERQRVEIVRCLLQKPTLLILDEPTSVLTPETAVKLFVTLRRLASEGCSILYISHKLDEIRDLCTRATVLRAGRVTGNCDPRQETASSLARMMIGGELPHPRHRASATVQGKGSLEVRRLSLPAEDPFGIDLVDIELSVRGGEIVGIAGVAGNGQKELVAALSGQRTVPDTETIVVNGTPCAPLDAGERRALGLGFVPEERLGRGAVPEMSLAENALLTAWRRKALTRLGMIRFGATRSYASSVIAGFNVNATGPDAIARSLSGGNLQKFIVGRETMQAPRTLIVAQPTWGLDVGAAAQIRQALIDLRDGGVAVLVVSEELDELLEICDRIAVMARGRLSETLSARASNAETIGQMMTGASIGQQMTQAAGRTRAATQTIDAS